MIAVLRDAIPRWAFLEFLRETALMTLTSWLMRPAKRSCVSIGAFGLNV